MPALQRVDKTSLLKNKLSSSSLARLPHNKKAYFTFLVIPGILIPILLGVLYAKVTKHLRRRRALRRNTLPISQALRPLQGTEPIRDILHPIPQQIFAPARQDLRQSLSTDLIIACT